MKKTYIFQSILCTLFLLFTAATFSQTNATVEINHDVTLTSGTIKLNHNAVITVNYSIFKLVGGGIELKQSSSELNLNYAVLSIDNGDVTNKKGTVNFNYGRIQSCNANFSNLASSPNGTFGTISKLFR